MDRPPPPLMPIALVGLLAVLACQPPREGDVAQLDAVLFSGERFAVAGGLREYEDGEYAPYATRAILAMSPDGETWEPHLPDVDAEWTALATGEGRWLAVSDCVEGDGAVAISEGGTTWTAYTGLPDACFHSAAVREGRFFAAQRPGGLFESMDGVTWDEVERTLDGGGGPAPWADGIDGVAYHGGTFVAWWGGATATSADGSAWEAPGELACGDGACDAIARVMPLDDGFAALATRGGGDEPVPYLATSADGASWTAREVPAALRAVAHGGDVYVGVAEEHLYWSDDGEAWTRGDKLAWDRARTDVAFGAGRFLAPGEATLMTSEDGKRWDEIDVAP